MKLEKKILKASIKAAGQSGWIQKSKGYNIAPAAGKIIIQQLIEDQENKDYLLTAFNIALDEAFSLGLQEGLNTKL